MPKSAGMSVDGGRPAGGRGASPTERVTVNLTARASKALEELVELTGDSKTDSINRALSVYAYIERITRNGGAVLVREGINAEPRQLVIF